jgi:hypothetical protein
MMALSPDEQLQEYARTRVYYFVSRFDESYRWLVYYASIPLILTAELLGYLHSQFLYKHHVPWEADADLLLSSLCEPIGETGTGEEQFAMDVHVRAVVLSEAEQRLGSPRIEQVGRLLLSYIHQLRRNSRYGWERELQTQRWAAMALIDNQRNTLITEIREAMRKASSPDDIRWLKQITQDYIPQLQAYPELLHVIDLAASQFATLDTDPLQLYEETDNESDEALVTETKETVERIWAQQPDIKRVASSLRIVASVFQKSTVSLEVSQLNTLLSSAYKQLGAVINLLEQFDLLYRLEIQCFNGLVYEQAASISEPIDQERLAEYALQVQGFSNQLRMLAEQLSSAGMGSLWLRYLTEATTDLASASKEASSKELDKAIDTLRNILTIQPPRINTTLNKNLANLQFAEITQSIHTMARIHIQNPEVIDQIEKGMGALDQVDLILTQLQRERSGWQDVVTQTRFINFNEDDDLIEIADHWPQLRLSTKQLYKGYDERWAKELQRVVDQLDAALHTNDISSVPELFANYRGQVAHRLWRMSLTTQRLSEDIQQALKPLIAVVEQQP